MASDQMLIPFHSGNDSEKKKKRDYKKCKSPSFPTPRKSKKGTKTAGNPFSDRGLDKFEELLADIEKKKKMIHSKVGPEDVYYVSFKYSPSNDCVPVVVKLKDRNGEEFSKKNTKIADFKDDKKDSNNFGAHETKVLDKSPRKESSTPVERIEKKGFSWNLMLHKWRRPSFYMPVILILILLLLLFFGRSVVTLYISIGWYVLPTISSKKPLKKKVYKRGFSELKMASEGLSSPKISKTNAPAKLKFFQNQKSF